MFSGKVIFPLLSNYISIFLRCFRGHGFVIAFNAVSRSLQHVPVCVCAVLPMSIMFVRSQRRSIGIGSDNYCNFFVSKNTVYEN